MSGKNHRSGYSNSKPQSDDTSNRTRETSSQKSSPTETEGEIPALETLRTYKTDKDGYVGVPVPNDTLITAISVLVGIMVIVLGVIWLIMN